MEQEVTIDGVEMTLMGEDPWLYYAGERDGVKIIKLLFALPDKEVEARVGEFMTEEDFPVHIAHEDCEVYKPDTLAFFKGLDPNLLLITLRKNVIPKEICEVARENLRTAASKTDNRGYAAGKLDLNRLRVPPERVIRTSSPFRAYYKTLEGKRSRTHLANQVHSGVVGFFDNSNHRVPFCRETKFTREFPERFEAAVPFVQEVSKQFERLIPNRWEAQRDYSETYETEKKGFIIPGTVFTTVTVNRNFRTALHTDKGDLHEGFGNLTVLEKGEYTGGYTGFPKYGVAANVRTGDFLGMDVHEYHGNTELEGIDEEWERISVVCYYRENMANCDNKDAEDAKRAAWKESGYKALNAADDQPVVEPDLNVAPLPFFSAPPAEATTETEDKDES